MLALRTWKRRRVSRASWPISPVRPRPLLGLAVAIGLLWDRMVGYRELTIMAVGYLVAGLGITVGYHRLFTHRSFQTSRAVRYAFAICGQFAVQGTWLAGPPTTANTIGSPTEAATRTALTPDGEKASPRD